MFAIGRWGARFLGAPRPDDVLLPRALLVAISAGFRPERAAGRGETYELRIGRLVFEVAIKDGRCTTREGSAVTPHAVFVMDVTTLNALLLEGLSALVDESLVRQRETDTGEPRFSMLEIVREYAAKTPDGVLLLLMGRVEHAGAG